MFKHFSVLNEETVNNVLNDKSGIYIDGTLGGGGHSKKLLSLLSDKGQVIAFDQDNLAIKNAKQEIKSTNFQTIHANFKNLTKELNKRGIKQINGLILDLGFSSPQIDDPSRGFSYMQDGPLDMRMDITQSKTAYDIINNYSAEELVKVFFKYGEEKNAKIIVKKIVQQRNIIPIKTTLELVEIIETALPYKLKKKITGHNAKKIFQALRIEVNEELKVLDDVLEQAFLLLANHGRISVITFHSLEDKIVKNKFKKFSEVSEELKNLPQIPQEYLPKGKKITTKPILPSSKELTENSRSKSAKLRVLEKNEK
ncbi:MAG: 16S rRNA (cytosine(1402)-N(4))-methyltransferase RsmH [Mycoplasmatales bacterium]